MPGEQLGLEDHEPDILMCSGDKNDAVNNEKDIMKAEKTNIQKSWPRKIYNGVVIARVDKLDNSFKEMKDVVDALTSMITSTQRIPFVPPNYPYILTPLTTTNIASPSTINSTNAIMHKLSLEPLMSTQGSPFAGSNVNVSKKPGTGC